MCLCIRSNDFDATWREARALRQAGTQVLAVGIGRNVGERELEAIASEPVDDNVLRVPSFNQLSSLINSLSNAICDGIL